MRRIIRKSMGLFIIVFITTMMIRFTGKASDTGIVLNTSNNTVPTFNAENSNEVTLCLKNTSKETLSNLLVYPIIPGDESWPFVTAQQDYSQTIDTIVPNQIIDLKFKFVARKDVESKQYSVVFGVSTDAGEILQKTVYINAVAKPEDKPSENKNTQQPGNEQPGNEEAPPEENSTYYDQGVVTAGDYTTSGGGSAWAGTPRVIVTGFTTNPGTVKAGDDFTLTVHLKNTSTSSKVANMLFDFLASTEGEDEASSAPSFLPASGSSSVFLDGIAAGATADISIALNAKSDLVNKPYSLNLSMKYEDGSANQIETTSGLSIPIRQEARFELSEFELSPDSIAVGEEANVMCSLYNLGRVKLYNVKATFEGGGIKKETVYVGNVDSGGNASIDAMLEGKKADEKASEITMTLEYEDESGKISSMKKELSLSVTKQEGEAQVTDEMAVEEKNAFPTVPVVTSVLALAAASFIIIRKRRKKERRGASEEEELLDEIDGSFKD